MSPESAWPICAVDQKCAKAQFLCSRPKTIHPSARSKGSRRSRKHLRELSGFPKSRFRSASPSPQTTLGDKGLLGFSRGASDENIRMDTFSTQEGFIELCFSTRPSMAFATRSSSVPRRGPGELRQLRSSVPTQKRTV